MRRRELLQGVAASSVLLSCKDGCRPTTRADVGGAVVDDVSRLNPVRVRQVIMCRSVDDVVKGIARAKELGVRVIASGRRHSQGGHCAVDDGVVLDMTSMNRITVDEAAGVVVVEAGATWDGIQRALNPKGLAVRTMQSTNIFTVGGSIASNIHGRDVDDSVFISTIARLTLIGADGKPRVIEEGDPLLSYVCGGFGLFGVVVEATIKITKNVLMAHKAQLMPAKDLPAFYRSSVEGTGHTLFIARPSIASTSFLDETIVETWTPTDEAITDAHLPLMEEENVQRDKLLFDASRASQKGKDARWVLQKDAALHSPSRITRNNAMRPPTAPLLFLLHTAPDNTDIVQEYFIPFDKYGEFLDRSRTLMQASKTNLLNLTIRYVKADAAAVLSHAPSECFSFMFYTNQPVSHLAEHPYTLPTRRLVDAALDVGGRHYLTYQLWATRDQVEKGYPKLAQFKEEKKKQDPAALFSNRWADTYLF